MVQLAKLYAALNPIACWMQIRIGDLMTTDIYDMIYNHVTRGSWKILIAPLA